ncbi:MAG: hypothetical protein ACI4JS_10265 [Oscillospiraceae bacterium]
MEDKIILFGKSFYNKAKLITYGTKSFPKDDCSDRWIVEYYDVYEDGTEILTRAAECDKERVGIVTYLLSK